MVNRPSRSASGSNGEPYCRTVTGYAFLFVMVEMIVGGEVLDCRMVTSRPAMGLELRRLAIFCVPRAAASEEPERKNATTATVAMIPRIIRRPDERGRLMLSRFGKPAKYDTVLPGMLFVIVAVCDSSNWRYALTWTEKEYYKSELELTKSLDVYNMEWLQEISYLRACSAGGLPLIVKGIRCPFAFIK